VTLALVLCAALALGMQVATAAYAPTAWTGEASPVTQTTAMLKGVVGPGNQDIDYYFQYGQTSVYEAQTPATLAGGGTQPIHVSAAISGLSAATLYHYRLVVTNPSYMIEGTDQTFTTKKDPLTFTLATRVTRSMFGSSLTVAGTLAGTGSAGHVVELQANPFPFLGGFKSLVGPLPTSSDGSFSFAVPKLLQNTQLRVATLDTPPVYSPIEVALVAVRVTLNLRPTSRHGFARLYGTVRPAEVGAPVEIQLLRPVGGVVTVASTLVKRGTATVSRFSRVVRIRRAGLYRAFVDVLSGAQISNHSRAVLIR
jgi:hypothetical protein